MGIPCKTYLRGEHVWKCRKCKSHLAGSADFISNGFSGKTGRACLFGSSYNTKRQRQRCTEMSTGTYIVQYLNCQYCEAYLGWAYVKAFKPGERYKEGKCVLELSVTALEASDF